MVFVTRYGLYEYTVLPLGLFTASLTFQRLMNDIMGKYIDVFVLVYLDDILMFSTTAHQHVHHLGLVFQNLREHKLQAKLRKCEFRKSTRKVPWPHCRLRGRYMWIRIRLLQLLIGKHPQTLRQSSSFWVLPIITTGLSLISRRWLPQLVTRYPTIRNSSGHQSSNMPMTP